MDKKIIVGQEEWCSLPDLKIDAIKIRIDSGAKTSCLHAFNVHIIEEKGKEFVTFDIHPLSSNRFIVKNCKAPLKAQRMIKSSSGFNEKRYVILTKIVLGSKQWEIEVTLTNRDAMGYRMLLGREAMQDKILVDPSSSFCLGNIAIDDPDFAECNLDKSLKIALLASDKYLYSNNRIIEVARQNGHQIFFVNIKTSFMNVTDKPPIIYYDDNKQLDNINAVITRIRPGLTFYGSAIARQLKSSGAFCINEPLAISRTRDKLLSLQMLAAKSINLPKTGFASSPKATKSLIKLVGGSPLLIRILDSNNAEKHSIIADNDIAAENIINAFKSIKANILVQEYKTNKNNAQLVKCYVIDNKFIGAVKINDNNFIKIKLEKLEKKTIISVAKILGLKLASIDVIKYENTIKIIDIDPTPSLQMPEDILNKDIAQMIIKTIEKHVLGQV